MTVKSVLRFLALSLLLISTIGFAQSSTGFEILDNGGLSDVSSYETALSSLNLDRYRASGHRVVMEFSSGVRAELYSLQELNRALPSDGRQKPLVQDDPCKGLVFTLDPSGILLEDRSGTRPSK